MHPVGFEASGKIHMVVDDEQGFVLAAEFLHPYRFRPGFLQAGVLEPELDPADAAGEGEQGRFGRRVPAVGMGDELNLRQLAAYQVHCFYFFACGLTLWGFMLPKPGLAYSHWLRCG